MSEDSGGTSVASSSSPPSPSTESEASEDRDAASFEFTVTAMLDQLMPPAIPNDRVFVDVYDRVAAADALALSDADHFRRALGIPGTGSIDEAEAETGWGAETIRLHGSVESPPERFAVVVGPVSWNEDAADLGGGVASLGEGSDFARNVSARTQLRPIGRPLRVADDGGVLAASSSTDLLRGWLDGSAEPLGNDDRFSTVARAFDERGVFQAAFIDGSFDVDRRFEDLSPERRAEIDLPEVPIKETFDLVAYGVVERDGELGEVIAWVFADEGAASRAVDQIIVAASADQPAAPGRTDHSLSTFYEIIDIVASGRAVIADVAYTDDGAPGSVTHLINVDDLAFVHP
ncbi:MAG: hypothetical protein AAGA42_06285 [Actinomycetota bacterium]